MNNPPDFQLILVDSNASLCKAWKKAFKPFPEVKIVHGLFQNIQSYDCIVSAANSFGQMDKGVDLAITNYFGRQLQQRVQQRILEDFYGEQPVGTSFIIPTGDSKFPFLAHTPTMRVPMPINNTDNVYNAMFAMLRAIAHHNRSGNSKHIGIVVCPALGTNTGQIPVDEAARQMFLAYKNFVNPPEFPCWSNFSNRQLEIVYGGDVFARKTTY